MVMVASMLIAKSVAPMQKLIANWKDLVAAKQSYDRLNALLQDDAKREMQMQLPAVMGHMAVSKASAVPPGHNKPVLMDIDFQVMPGQAVAVVGPSAAGKTCLARLLVGIWKPARGSVRLDAVELSDWNPDEFGPQIGYVPQEIEFFEGTVAENIARLGEIDPEKVVQAAKLIGMHEIILGFPKGYDTELGETGFALSGGQRQRLAIARAFYGIPKYIVMDEPNANLDEVGESALVQAVSYLKTQGSAIIMTTHRPRLVSVVDKLLVLRNGQQVGFGPAEDMINAVRNLQVVPPGEEATDAGEVADDWPVRVGVRCGKGIQVLAVGHDFHLCLSSAKAGAHGLRIKAAGRDVGGDVLSVGLHGVPALLLVGLGQGVEEAVLALERHDDFAAQFGGDALG
jgi:ATP-binding cassette subfamily C exporter for protease/lipase/ATP-binding cassette subfamily C protein EexD